ncbi:MAG: carboxylating nicotinate-nucleotide diphosphorylase [Dehalococcoidia bacterium]|nr:MAG: carboxylating nicotinate-nucleotide diphosphorylase [Dehalococcoidia bacterium]
MAQKEVRQIIALALAEDRVADDVTSKLVIPEDLDATATLLAKAEGILAGVEVFKAVFERVDKKLRVEILKHDSSRLVHGDIAAVVRGRARSILAAERTAMNFVCHLSGIATTASRYVERVAGLPVSIVDTRKTSAGQRLLEKHAVSCGGGRNHRLNLADGILIKDNHIAALRRSGLSLGQIVNRAKERNRSGLKIEVEVNNMAEAIEAAAAGADMLLLDNMSVADMKNTVERLKGRVRFEASGGITLENVREVAETGVDIISIGALTHSVKALDFSLEME